MATSSRSAKSDEHPVDTDYTDHAAEAWAHVAPGTDLSVFSITMRLRRIVNELDHLLASVIDGTPLAAYGDYQVLSLLRRSRQPMQPSELADALQVTRSGMTGRLHRLEQLDLIRRRPHPDDARRAFISITPKGARFADRLFSSGQEVQATAFEPLSSAERETLADLLRRILIALMDTPIDQGPEPGDGAVGTAGGTTSR